MKKDIFTHKTIINYTVGIIATGVFIFVIVFPTCTIAETASISNSVSISSNGNGTSHASLKTVVNGVVVEDRSVEGSGTLESHIVTANESTTVYTTTDNTGTEEQKLLILLEKLNALLHYYVSLLSAQS